MALARFSVLCYIVAVTVALSQTTNNAFFVNAFSLRMNTAAANKKKVNVIAGATGYIGKSVVRESVRQGYQTIALVRDASKVSSSEGKALFGEFFEGAKLVECDVTNPDNLLKVNNNCFFYSILLSAEFHSVVQLQEINLN